MLDALRPSRLIEIADRANTDKGSLPGELGHPHHYAPIYERFLNPVREQPLHLLEIGVHKGASLRMWQEYLPNARIVGVDIDRRSAEFATARAKVIIGDATDRAFVRGVVTDHLDGVVDVVIDDGSHRLDEQIAAFEHLFPLLEDGGLYFVEDIVCSRFAPWNERRRGFADFYEFASHLAEQLTYFPGDSIAAYHSITDTRELAAPEPPRSAWNEWLHEVSLFHNIAVLTKARRTFPRMAAGTQGSAGHERPLPEIPEGSLTAPDNETTFAARRRTAGQATAGPSSLAGSGVADGKRPGSLWRPEIFPQPAALPRAPIARLAIRARRTALRIAKPAFRDAARSALEALPLSERGRRRWWKRACHLLDIAEGAMPPGATTGRRYDLVVLSNIGLDGKSMHRPHHVTQQHARNGHRVFYILADPVLNRTDPRPYSVKVVEPNLYQIRLRAIGFDHYGGVIGGGSIESFETALGELVRDFRIAAAMQHVHLPSWTALAVALRNRFLWPIIYDCMDEWDGFPAIGKRQVELEPELIAAADAVTFTSSNLLKKKGGPAKRTALIRNGVDFGLFQQNCRPNNRFSFPKPTIGFYGSLAQWIDFELLVEVVRRRPEWRFVFAGRQSVAELRGLDAEPNVTMLGELPYEAMPELLWHFDVAINPFLVNHMTDAVDPVKLHEYLAGGKPVVATPIRELTHYSDVVRLADTPESFSKALEEALADNSPENAARRRQAAQTSTWAAHYRSFDQLATELFPKVSVVVVTFDNLGLTRKCLNSVLGRTMLPQLEVIVVDNASSDGTAAYLRELAAHDPRVRLVLNAENRGFAAANNQALAISTGPVLVLLNNDVVVPRGWLRGLLRTLADEKVGLVGPVTNSVGNEAWIPTNYRSQRDMEDFAARHMSRNIGARFDIAMLAMYCVAMRREVWELVGPLDEAFGIGMFEDDDYAQRIRQAGLDVVCAPESFVHHYGQASFRKLIADGSYDRLWKKNQAYFESKWGPWVPHVSDL